MHTCLCVVLVKNAADFPNPFLLDLLKTSEDASKSPRKWKLECFSILRAKSLSGRHATEDGTAVSFFILYVTQRPAPVEVIFQAT